MPSWSKLSITLLTGISCVAFGFLYKKYFSSPTNPNPKGNIVGQSDFNSNNPTSKGNSAGLTDFSPDNTNSKGNSAGLIEFSSNNTTSKGNSVSLTEFSSNNTTSKGNSVGLIEFGSNNTTSKGNSVGQSDLCEHSFIGKEAKKSAGKVWSKFPYEGLLEKSRMGYPGQIEKIADWKMVMHPKTKKIITVYLVYWKSGIDHLGNIKIASWIDLETLNDAVQKSEGCRMFDGIEEIQYKEDPLGDWNEEQYNFDEISGHPTSPRNLAETRSSGKSSGTGRENSIKKEHSNPSPIRFVTHRQRNNYNHNYNLEDDDTIDHHTEVRNLDLPEFDEYSLQLQDSKRVQIQKLEEKIEELQKKLERKDTKYTKLKEEQDDLFEVLGERNLKLKTLKTKLGLPLSDEEEDPSLPNQ